MARKPTDKQLFKMKNEWLGQFYEEVKPKDFYRAVFPEGSFEREGHPEDLMICQSSMRSRGQSSLSCPQSDILDATGQRKMQGGYMG
mgnify:CR=1 FL=1